MDGSGARKGKLTTCHEIFSYSLAFERRGLAWRLRMIIGMDTKKLFLASQMNEWLSSNEGTMETN